MRSLPFRLLLPALLLPLGAMAQLLPPDAADLSRVRIPESLARVELCPVTLALPVNGPPPFMVPGTLWRCATE